MLYAARAALSEGDEYARTHGGTWHLFHDRYVATGAFDQHEIDSFRQELFKTDGNEKLDQATFELSEGANGLKNAMGALVAYTGDPNPATLAHFSTQLQQAKAKWNEGVEQVWQIAHESGAMILK